MKLSHAQFLMLKSLAETGDARAHQPHIKGCGATWLTLCRKGLVDGVALTERGVAALASHRVETQEPSRARKIGDFGRTSELRGLSKPERDERIDLGLAIARCHAKPGTPMSLQLLAEFCGCTDGTILMYERNALKKLRKRLAPELQSFFKR